MFTFPLRHRDLQLGALDLYRDEIGPLSADSMSAAQTLADVAAAYLINAQARADLQDSSDQSRDAALHDALTGLPNRVLMLELLEHAFRASRRSGKTSAVFFIDLDRFKDVNDTYGHYVGDELLVAVAERLTGTLRPGDSLARLSGDEFVVLCEELADRSGADLIAVRLNAELSRPFVLSDVEVNVTASIGIAFTGQDVDAPEDLLRDADLAMYRSKRERAGSHAVLDLRELHLAGHQAGLARPAEIGMSVNVSGHQFMSAGFAATVARVLDSTSADPALLTLEVTESVFVRDEERALVDPTGATRTSHRNHNPRSRIETQDGSPNS